MKKRILSAIVAFMLICSGLPISFAALSDFTTERSYSNQFTDVPASAWYYNNVKTAYELGLVNGSSATTYSPDDNITIAEVQTLVARIHSTYHGNTIAPVSGAWYAPYVEYCIDNIDSEICSMAYMQDGNVVTADQSASRTYFAYLMYAALPSSEYTQINAIADGELPDVDDIVFMDADERIYTLYRAGILTGSDEQGTFYPDTNITRAEVAAIISRMIDPSQRIRREDPDGYTYQIETAYNVANVREMLVDNSGSLYYATNDTIYQDGSVIFDGYMPVTVQNGYYTYEYENWYLWDLATDAEHERVYGLLYSWVPDSSAVCLMGLDLKTGEILGTYASTDYEYLRMQSSGDSCSMLNAVIDSSGAVIYNNGVNRWNFAAAPTLYISGNASTPETYGMHLGYAGGELMGLGSEMVHFNINQNTIDRIEITAEPGADWRATTLISSDYDGKFYSLSRNGFGLVCIDPESQQSSVLVDGEHVKILDGMPLSSNIVAQQCSIIAAGEDSYYLFYPESACIRKLVPLN